MAPDIITLSVIRHEDTVHAVKTRSLLPILSTTPTIDPKSLQVQITECNSSLSSETINNMGNQSDARTRALASMYGTSIVFNQNQKNLVKSLPWSSKTADSTASSPPNSITRHLVPTSEEMQQMVEQLVHGRGGGRKLVGDKQVQSLQSEKLRAEHAATMFALLT